MEHVPVMKEEVAKFVKGSGYFVDATTGTGGHTEYILKKFPALRAICIDRDEQSLQYAQKRLERFRPRLEFIHSDYRKLPDLNLPWDKIDSILFDMGLSSFQLSSERGFSYQRDTPLDMRFNRQEGKPASVLLREIPYSELVLVFKNFADLKRAEELAREIKRRKIETTSDLVDAVKRVYRTTRKELLSRVFQAIRIAVNRELEGIDTMIFKLLGLLPAGARLIFITYHSGEDRIVKNSFRKAEKEGKIKILTKRVIKPSREEILKNPRARSAKMRVGEK